MDLTQIANQINDMQITPEQIDKLNTTCRVAMAYSLVSSIQQLEHVEEQASSLTDRLGTFINGQIEAKLEAGSMTLDEAVNYLDRLSNMQVRAAETKRKIFNGREMFASDAISPREKALMEMLKQVDSPEKRQKLEQYIVQLTSSDFNKADKVAQSQPADGASGSEGDDSQEFED